MQTIVPKIGYAFKKKSFFGKLFIDFEKKKNLVKLSFSDPKLPLRTLMGTFIKDVRRLWAILDIPT